MPATYEPIATTTLGSATNIINFATIPTSYTDLVISMTATSANNPNPNLRFNLDAGTLYSVNTLYGEGTTTGAFSNFNQTHIWLYPDIETNPKFFLINIFDYQSTINKTVLYTGAGDINGSGRIYRCAGLYRSTSAITHIRLFTDSFNFAAGTTVTLYGIKRA